jgi:hypothetical protein
MDTVLFEIVESGCDDLLLPGIIELGAGGITPTLIPAATESASMLSTAINLNP